MFGIGGFELLIILIVGFVLLGDRLPDAAKTLGRAIRTFQAAQRDMSKVIKEDVFDPDAEEPFKDPLAALDKMGGIAKKTGSSLAGDFNEIAKVAKKKKPDVGSQASEAPTETSPASAQAGEHASTSEQDGASAAQSSPLSNTAGESAVPETFAERRERYEKERAARLAAKEQAAKEQEVAAAEQTEKPPVSTSDASEASSKGGE